MSDNPQKRHEAMSYLLGLALALVLTLPIFWTHRANITRIRQGSEPKIGQK